MNKKRSVFLTQKGKRRGHVDACIGADRVKEMVAEAAQTSQSVLLLKKKKEMREVIPVVEATTRDRTGCREGHLGGKRSRSCDTMFHREIEDVYSRSKGDTGAGDPASRIETAVSSRKG